MASLSSSYSFAELCLYCFLREMKKDLGSYRKSYDKDGLTETALPANPKDLFQRWFQELETFGGLEEPNAMTIATIGLDGFPKSRVVLMKFITEEGFIFFTNYNSEKGQALAADPRICLSFYWPNMERQVIVKGKAEKVPPALSDEYFASRPKGSKLGALASDQSRVLASRAVLEEKLKNLEELYKDKPVDRPEHWGGYLVRPNSMEFWQGRPNRLHDRIRYVLHNDGKWNMERLAP